MLDFLILQWSPCDFCSDAATSDDLARAVQDLEGIPIAQQRLVCSGRPLRPGAMLSKQHMTAASRVELLLRLEGGAPKKGKDKKGKDKKGKDKGDKGGKAPLGEARSCLPSSTRGLCPVLTASVRAIFRAAR